MAGAGPWSLSPQLLPCGARRGEAGGGELASGALNSRAGGHRPCVAVQCGTESGLSASAQPPLASDRLKRGAGGGLFRGEKGLVPRCSGDVPPRTDGSRRARFSPVPRRGGGLGVAGWWRFVGQWVGRALRRCRSLGELSVGRFPLPPFPLTRDGGSSCCWQKPAGSRFVLCKRMLMAGPAMR